MKRLFIFFTVLIFTAFNCNIETYAQDDEALFIADELAIDLDGASSGLTAEAEEFIAEHGISIGDAESMLKLSPLDVISYAFDSFKSNLVLPVKTLTSMLAVILLSSVVEGLGNTAANKQLSKTYGIVCVLVSVNVIIKPVTACIGGASETITSGGHFMLTYIPVFAGLTASAGNISSAAAYNMIVAIAAQAAVQFTSGLLVPAISVCMALGVVGAVNPDFNLTSITGGIKKASSFALGFIMTIFIGLLSIQSILGTSVDTLGIKAAKFMASSFIPVIGGAVADAYSTVRSSLGLLKSGVGFFGVAAIFITVLPSLMQVIAMRLVFSAGEVAADLFGVSRLKVLFKNTADILALMFSLLVCFSVMFILSTAILMLTGLNMS
ncbi:MAG: stage III sporulation protein AE [Oscillospiraceae bacterium]|nr:stage III sporulation protein AE [Oscillospiraceae bacterium]